MKKRKGSAESNKHSFYPQADWPVGSASLAIAAPIACWFCASARFGEKISTWLKSKSCAHHAQYGPRRHCAFVALHAWTRTPLISHLLHLANNGRQLQPMSALIICLYLAFAHSLYLKVLYNIAGDWNSPATTWTHCHDVAVAQGMKLIHAAREVANN